MYAPLLDEKRLRVAVADWSITCGRRVAKRRRDLNFSQENIGKLVGVSATSISKFELGLANPKDSVRVAIACALLCEVTDLWPPMDRNYAMSVARSAVAA